MTSNVEGRIQRLSRSQTGTLQMLVGTVLISFSAVFVRVANVGPTTAGLYRMVFGALFLIVVVLIKRQTLWRGWKLFGLGALAAGATGTGSVAVTADTPGLHQILVVADSGGDLAESSELNNQRTEVSTDRCAGESPASSNARTLKQVSHTGDRQGWQKASSPCRVRRSSTAWMPRPPA